MTTTTLARRSDDPLEFLARVAPVLTPDEWMACIELRVRYGRPEHQRLRRTAMFALVREALDRIAGVGVRGSAIQIGMVLDDALMACYRV